MQQKIQYLISEYLRSDSEARSVEEQWREFGMLKRRLVDAWFQVFVLIQF